MNRSTQNGQLVGFEFLMLDGRDTALVFVAHPSRQATTIFPATAVSDGRVEFANPAHFPTAYRVRAPCKRFPARVDRGSAGRWTTARRVRVRESPLSGIVSHRARMP
jgi:hypothetical protein